MAQEKYTLSLQLTLKKVAMCSIARTLWLASDIEDTIDNLIDSDKLLLIERCTCKNVPFWYNVNPIENYNGILDYEMWEEVTDSVLQKTASLCLPKYLKKDLEKIIAVIGERLFYQYCGDQQYCGSCRKTKGRIPFSGVQEISPLGTYDEESYFLAKNKFYPEKTNDLKLLDLDFLEDACLRCFEEAVAEYQDDVVTYLLDLPDGFDLDSTKDKIFNIICIYHYTRWHPIRDPDGVQIHYGRYPIPKEYMQNSDFVIPLEEVSRLFVTENYIDTFIRIYFAQKLNALKALSLKADFPCILHHNVLLERLWPSLMSHFCEGESYLFLINWMEKEEQLKFIRKNIYELIVLYLPVWPFQEVVPGLLNICFENDFDLDYEFLLELVSISIGIQKKRKHPVHKQFFSNVFKKIWNHTPEEMKSAFKSEMIENNNEKPYRKLTMFEIVRER